MIRNVLEYLENAVRQHPDKLACADEKTALTYMELETRAKIIGTHLAKKITPEAPVPVFMEKGTAALSLFMGAVYAGGFYTLLDPAHPAERIQNILDTLEAQVIIADEKSMKKVEKLGFTGTVLEASSLFEGEIDEILLEKIREGHLDIMPLYSIFTSGSTGVPKGVVVNHRSTIDFIECFTETFGITGEEIIGNQAPFDFDVSVKDIYSSLKTGATLQIIPKKMFSFPMELLDFLEDRRVTTLIWAVSALCIVTTLNGFSYKAPQSLKKIMFSGEVMPIKHLNKWRAQYPKAMFVNLYGPTEITCNCTYYIVDREFGLDEKLPMGKAFANEKVFLLDEDDRLVSPDMPEKLGEICVSGTAVTMGYYNNAERTNAAFVQNPLNKKYIEIIYRTGDLGQYTRAGELLFASRKDFQIKHMGHRIELGEIETFINAVEGIARVCCIFDQDENKIIAFYEGDVEKKLLIRELGKKLPKFMIPNVFEQVAAMPITQNGKIDRKQLMEDFKKNAE